MTNQEASPQNLTNRNDKKKDNVQTIYTIDATIKIVILTQHVKNEKLWTSMLQSVYKLQNNAVKNALLFLVFKKISVTVYVHLFRFWTGFVQVNPLKPKILILKINLYFLL